MISKILLGASLATSVLFFSGCAGLLPSDSEVKKSMWHSYDEAIASFDKIVINKTTLTQLKAIGFDPKKTPNIKILTFLDIKKQFITTTYDKAEYLPAGVQECIESMDTCHGLGINILRNDSKRYGNTFLDIFNFRRQTEQTGWEFDGLIVLKDNVVVYKLAGGQPFINGNKDQSNPLGPLQSVDGLLFLNRRN